MNKIRVPEEFAVFLESAEAVATKFRNPNTNTVDLFQITSNLAKFRYYLLGRLEGLDDITKLVEKNKDQRLSDLILEEIKSVTQVNLYLDTLLGEINN